MARLGITAEERERYYAQAFDANPFSLPLIRDYQHYLGAGAGTRAAEEPAPTSGYQLRLVLQQMQRGELVAATSTTDTLLRKFPNNDTLMLLRREIEERRTAGPVVLRPQPTAADLRAILAAFNENRLTAEQRSQLDRMTFTSTAIFEEGPPFESGNIDGVPFRFSEPTTFNRTFASGVPLRFTYRILGATQQRGADALLLEPLRLEAAP